jgi:phosphopantothenoylcysteine decarboxylase/phosphopantothenate--cysteine ligase
MTMNEIDFDIVPKRLPAIEPGHLLIAISGSISSAFIHDDLIWLLDKTNVGTLSLVATPSAQHMLSTEVFQSRSRFDPRLRVYSGRSLADLDPIELTRSIDAMLVYPASANTIGQVAGGFSDTIVAACCMTTESQVAFAPCMNTSKWIDESVQQNVMKLRERGHLVIGPRTGRAVANGSYGIGGLERIDTVYRELVESLSTT